MGAGGGRLSKGVKEGRADGAKKTYPQPPPLQTPLQHAPSAPHTSAAPAPRSLPHRPLSYKRKSRTSHTCQGARNSRRNWPCHVPLTSEPYGGRGPGKGVHGQLAAWKVSRGMSVDVGEEMRSGPGEAAASAETIISGRGGGGGKGRRSGRWAKCGLGEVRESDRKVSLPTIYTCPPHPCMPPPPPLPSPSLLPRHFPFLSLQLLERDGDPGFPLMTPFFATSTTLSHSPKSPSPPNSHAQTW